MQKSSAEGHIGIMRCNYKLNNWDKVPEAVEDVLKLPGVSQEIQIEAIYSRASPIRYE